jgi:hypothetical protein
MAYNLLSFCVAFYDTQTYSLFFVKYLLLKLNIELPLYNFDWACIVHSISSG